MNRYIIILSFLFFVSIFNNLYSQDEISLFGYDIKKIPYNYLNPTNLSVTFPLFLYPNYYRYYPINTSNGDVLNIYLNSTVPLHIYIFDVKNFHNFRDGISYYSYYENYTNYIHKSISLPSGEYYLVIYNDNPVIAYYYFYYFQSNKSIDDIYLPIGVSDFGVYFNGQQYLGYTYKTTLVVGKVYMKKFNASVDPICSYSSLYNDAGSVQLNAVLEIDTYDGPQYYWLQNVLAINNSGGYYYIINNIWNMSRVKSILNNNSIIGEGAVYFYNRTDSFYYAYATETYDTNYPINLYLIISVYQDNLYPKIKFGYSFDGKNIIWYDNVTLLIPSTNSYIIVEPNLTTSGHLKDLELIIGGPGESSCIDVKDIDAYLGLYFLYNEKGKYFLSPIPYAFNFGLDTAETATNAITILDNGKIQLLVGKSYPNYLGEVKEFYYKINIYYKFNDTYIEYKVLPYDIINLIFPNITFYNGREYYLDNIKVNGKIYYTNNITLLADKDYNIILNYIPIFYIKINYIGPNFYEIYNITQGSFFKFTVNSTIYQSDNLRWKLSSIFVNG
ncbi:MAG: thermopsin family protease, partial [Nanopusillaceae archaeon]